MTEQLTEPGPETEIPSGPIRISWAPVPQVNLLPLEIVEKRRFRQIQIGLAAAVLAAVVLGALGLLWAQRDVSNANNELSAAQSSVTALQAQQARFSAVPQVIAEVDAATAARTLAMGNDVLWYRYLNDLDGAQPAGVGLTGLQITLYTTAATSSGNPLASAGIGTVTINGFAGQYSEVSAWMDATNKIVGLSSSSLATAVNAAETPDTTAVTFTSGAVIDTDALSDRYSQKAS